jgi:hypothetical protein
MEECMDCGLVLEDLDVQACPRCGGEYSKTDTMAYHLVCGRNVMSCECVDEEGARP